MSTVLPFGSNTLTVYSYESFSYTLSNPNSNLYTLSLSNSAGILPGYISNYGNAFVVFSSASNTMQAGTQAFVVSAVDASGTVVQSSSNTVSVQAGRLLDSSGASLAGSNYTFYAKEAITPIKIVAPFSLAPPTVTPSFPPGLTFTPTDGNTVFISGTPLTTLPQSNYLIIARQANGSKIATARVGMVVSNERIAVSVDRGQVISQMKQDTVILPRTMTTRANGVVRYTWSNFPDGIVVTDVCGTIQPPSTYGFTPVDPSHTIVIQGAPSFAAIMDFKDKGYLSGFTTSVLVERLSPLPVLSSNVPITFAFGEAVLFDQSFITVPTSYVGVTLDPSANYMRAQTYFTSNVAITSMSANRPAPPGLSFVYNGIDRLYLTGTPTSAPFGYTYTISASNANGTQAPGGGFDIEISNDSVSFTSPTPVDTCYNFVLSRPLTLSLSGYYPTPVEVRAVAASGKAVTITAPALAGTGLSLSNVGNSTVRIVGTPSALLPLQAVSFQATVSGSPATGSTDLSLAIVADTFTISGPALIGIQNKAITPLQYTASTLSGRPVVSFSSQNLPAGLSLSPTGLLTGTPTADTTTPFTITASTGYATGSQPFSTTINPDNIVVAMVNDSETVATVFTGVEFRALTYSGKEGVLTTGGNAFRVPIQRTQFDVSFASDGISLGGNFSGLPGLLPAYRFRVTGTAGSYSADSSVDVAVTNPSIFVRMLGGLSNLSGAVNDPLSPDPPIPFRGAFEVRRNTDPPLQLTDPLSPFDFGYGATALSNWASAVLVDAVPYAVGDLARNGSTAVVVAGSNLVRSTDDGASWTPVPASNITALDLSGGPTLYAPPQPIYRPVKPLFACVATNGASEWVALANGYNSSNATDYTVIRQSVDNGVTWTDFSTSSITTLDSNSRLYFNASRYFLVSSNVWTAEASDLTTWTAATGLTGAMRAMAFSNSTILLVGSNVATDGYTSFNNGTTWAPLPTSPISGGGPLCNVAYAGGVWAVCGGGGLTSGIRVSSNLLTWSTTPDSLTGTYEVIAEDGGAWQATGLSNQWQTGVWDSTGAITFGGNTAQSLGWSNKTLLTYPASSGTPSLTLSIPYLGSNFAWVSPTQTAYTLWQFVSNTPITVQADSSTSTFLYYYASGLPDGLDLSLDSVGSQATIQGTSVAYSDAPKRVLLFANDRTSTLRRQLGMRTILPTVTKQQTSAGAWTSLVRQYTTVNAAQNARDQRVFAAVDRTLGEFTAPYPPDVVTQVSSNCQC
jgi:hypothetical protein